MESCFIIFIDSSDEESFQALIPFLTDVRLGSGDVTSSSVDLDESTGGGSVFPGGASSALSGSPPSGSPQASSGIGATLAPEKPRVDTTPPNSPNIASAYLK